MTRIKHILKELARNIGRNPATALGSVLSLILLFLLFDLFWVASATSDKFYQDLLSEIRLEVFLPEEFPDSLTASLSQSVVSLDEVISAVLISKEEARAELAGLLEMDLLIGYDSTNPLPRSLLLQIEPEYMNMRDMAALEWELAILTGSAEIHYSRRWLEKAEKTKSLTLKLGLVIGGLILLTTLINSANSIRLMARARAVGFRQMLLLGAGKLFIGLPFIIEGFLLTGLSAAAGWGVILYARNRIEFSKLSIVYPTAEEIVIFCLIAACLGGLSGYVGIRRLLK
jgi:cell division protein FtsX